MKEKKGSIYIGTSGWNYSHWQPAFYPEGMPSSQWLDYYRKQFSTVEINNTFYQLPSVRALQTWKESVGPDFIFFFISNWYITHMKMLKDPGNSLSRFFKRIEVLGGKGGPVLFQLPPRWRVDVDRLRKFIGMLSKTGTYTFEFRDTSWWTEDVYEILRESNGAFCIHDLAGTCSPKEVTADFVYVRLHGPGNAYEGLYDKETLAGWAGAFSAWRRQGLDVYCYFDNDQRAYAAGNAQELRAMVR